MNKADIRRLERMLKDLDEREATLQRRVGDRFKGSIRSRDYRDARALQRVLSALAVDRPTVRELKK